MVLYFLCSLSKLLKARLGYKIVGKVTIMNWTDPLNYFFLVLLGAVHNDRVHSSTRLILGGNVDIRIFYR